MSSFERLGSDPQCEGCYRYKSVGTFEIGGQTLQLCRHCVVRTLR